MHFSVFSTITLSCLLIGLGSARSIEARGAAPAANINGQFDSLGSNQLEIVTKREAQIGQASAMRYHTKEYKEHERKYWIEAGRYNKAKDKKTKAAAAAAALDHACHVADNRKKAETHAKKLGKNNKGHALAIEEWRTLRNTMKNHVDKLKKNL